MNPTKGPGVYRKKQGRFRIYLLDPEFHKAKSLPSPARSVSFLPDISVCSLKWIHCDTWLLRHGILLFPRR